MSKQDYVLTVLADMPDANASEVADAVAEQYDVDVTPAYVRVVKSRSAPGLPQRQPVARAKPDRAPALRTARPALRAPAPGPRPGPRAAEALADDDDELFAKIDRVVAALNRALSGQPRQVIATPAAIAEIARILDDEGLRADFPDFDYETFPVSDGRHALVIRAADYMPEPVYAKSIQVAIPVDIPKPQSRERKRSKKQEQGCEFCDGKRPVAPGVNLYRVTSQVFARPRILCQTHAMAESTVPGTDIRPYKIYGGQFSAGVLEPVMSPWQAMIGAAKTVVNDLLGSEEEQAYS